jgi:hypothetical protein
MILSVLVALFRGVNELETTTIASNVDVYEFSSDRSTLYLVQENTLKQLTFDTQEWSELMTLQNGEQDIPRTLYTGEDGLIIVSDATKEKSVLHVIADEKKEIPLFTQESLNQRPQGVRKTDFCTTQIGSPAQFEELGQYWIVSGKKGKQRAFAPNICREELEPYYALNNLPLTRNPFFDFEGTFIDSDTTLSDTRDDITIQSKPDREGFGDCSGFFGAVCPVTHTIEWQGKQFTLEEQLPHIGKSLPYSKFMSTAEGNPLLPTEEGDLLLLSVQKKTR